MCPCLNISFQKKPLKIAEQTVKEIFKASAIPCQTAIKKICLNLQSWPEMGVHLPPCPCQNWFLSCFYGVDLMGDNEILLF